MHKPIIRIAASIGIAAFAVPALAAPPAYLDDRSTAASLVKSFYNAVNRHEYARAYSYFGAGSAPQAFPQFSDGYAETTSVTVLTGQATGDGAAGSTYFTLPVAIDALQADGSRRQFAGCYTTRLVDPGIQDPPVVPMVIYKATLHAAHGSLGSILPHCQPN